MDIYEFAIGMLIVMAPAIGAAVVYVWRKNAIAIERGVQARIGETWWNLLEQAANTLINSAEQVTGIDTDEEKKEFVLRKLEDLAAMWNIPITTDLLDAIIEGIYKSWYKDSEGVRITRISGDDVSITESVTEYVSTS